MTSFSRILLALAVTLAVGLAANSASAGFVAYNFNAGQAGNQSFGGASFTWADGSVHFLSENIGVDHPPTVQVGGRVTLDGGDWPKPGRLIFTVLEPGSSSMQIEFDVRPEDG